MLLPDWSGFVDMPLSCNKYFRFPHAHKDYRRLIIATLKSILGIDPSRVTKFVHGGTYDGASFNSGVFFPNYRVRDKCRGEE